jgi:hypothetical protein
MTVWRVIAVGYGDMPREYIGWYSVYLTPKAGVGGGGDWLREKDKGKREKI